MAKTITIGMARIHAEAGERRDFLPPFVARLLRYGAWVVLERGCGSGIGLKEEDYRSAAPGVEYGSLEDVYNQEYVVVLRCPADEELAFLRPGSTLISMLHYPTRPQRVELLRSRGVDPFEAPAHHGHLLLMARGPSGSQHDSLCPAARALYGSAA